MAKLLAVEEMTFDNLEKVVKLYKDCTDDQAKLYHLSNGISMLDSLRTFIQSKMDIMTRGSGLGVGNDKSNIEVNVTGQGDIKSNKPEGTK